MKRTIGQLVENLTKFPLTRRIVIEDVDGQEFVITDFVLSENVLTIKIGEKSDSEEGEGE